MKSIRVYEYPACSTCKNALKFLKTKGVEFEAVDITKTPPSKTELKQMVQFYGGELKKLFNTSGVVYREMKLGDKVGTMKVDEAVDLLSKNGKLIKRPFVLLPETGMVGFKEADWKKVFA